MKKNTKVMIGILAALLVILIIGGAVFAAGTAKRILTRSSSPSASNTKGYGTEEYITEEEAKKAALEHAKFTENEVNFTKAYLDYDDGIAEYEISFYKDNVEYDYNIDAVNGSIRSYDSENEGRALPKQSNSADSGSNAGADSNAGSGSNSGSSKTTPQGDGSHIEESAAIEAALNHAGLTQNDVSRLRAQFDFDDGVAVYDVEFWVNAMEYNYEINAVSGEIISYDKEIDD